MTESVNCVSHNSHQMTHLEAVDIVAPNDTLVASAHSVDLQVSDLLHHALAVPEISIVRSLTVQRLVWTAAGHTEMRLTPLILIKTGGISGIRG